LAGTAAYAPPLSQSIESTPLYTPQNYSFPLNLFTTSSHNNHKRPAFRLALDG